MTENLILTDPKVEPENVVLEKALGKKFKLFTDFIDKISEQNFFPEWYYYNDGKSWLCKIMNRKKNYCWLSVWNTGFRLTFYFTEKTIDGVKELDINDKIKLTIRKLKPIGKSHPVILPVGTKSVMNDGIKILEYKLKLK